MSDRSFFAPLAAEPSGLFEGPWLTLAARSSPETDEADRSLGARLRRRDPVAWQQLFAAEMPGIFRYARSRLGDASEAEDATSHVFEEAWEHAGSFQDQGLPPRAWLFGIARNVVGTYRRRWLRRPPMLAIEDHDAAAHDERLSPDQFDLAQAITRLGRVHAEVVTLRFIHGLSLQETAESLGVTVDAIKGRQARALTELRIILEGPKREKRQTSEPST